jgi:hypothetical protein
MIELLVNLPSPISELQHAPSTPEVLRVKESAPTPSPSFIFTFGLVVESIKELGGASLPKLHQVIGIAYNNGSNPTHGKTITSFDAYHKATEWFPHRMNDLVLFKRYIQNLDTLELRVLIAFLLFITIGEVCMLKSEMSLLGMNNLIE